MAPQSASLPVGPRHERAVKELFGELQAENTASELESTALATEEQVLSRLLYKQKNQHRRAWHYHKLVLVRKRIRSFQNASLPAQLRHIASLHSISKTGRAFAPSQTDCSFCLQQCVAVARFLRSSLHEIANAAIPLGQLVSHSFFLPFATVCLSLIARVYCLFKHLLCVCTQCANALARLMPHLPSDGRRSLVRETLRGIPQHLEVYFAGTHAYIDQSGTVLDSQRSNAEDINTSGDSQKAQNGRCKGSDPHDIGEDVGAPVGGEVAAFAREDKTRIPDYSSHGSTTPLYSYFDGAQAAALGEEDESEEEEHNSHTEQRKESTTRQRKERSRKKMKKLEAHARECRKHSAFEQLTQGLL